MSRARVVVLLPLTLLAAACAAKSPSSARSPEPSADMPAGQMEATTPTTGPQGYPVQGQYPGQPSGTTTPQTPSPYAQPPPPPAKLEAPGRQAAREFDEAERRLLVATSDCAMACKALGSMDRAAGRICGLISTNDDQVRCTDAKDKVVSARTRVKNTCASCPDTSTDPKDPVPSR